MHVWLRHTYCHLPAAQVPNIFPNRKEDCSFSMDKAANSMSVVSNGKVCASEEEGVVLEYSKVGLRCALRDMLRLGAFASN